MPYRIKIIADRHGFYHPPQYLLSIDVDFAGGIGLARLTRNPDDALVFPDLASLMETWKARSTVRPWRLDGKPNRPLTAYTIEPELID